MNDAVAAAGVAQFERDALRKNPPPFLSNCAHRMSQLPIIDFKIDEVCIRCGGFVSRHVSQEVSNG